MKATNCAVKKFTGETVGMKECLEWGFSKASEDIENTINNNRNKAAFIYDRDEAMKVRENSS